MAGRNSVLENEYIELTAWFKDAGGNFVDPEASTLKMAVYPVGKDPRHAGITTADAFVYNVTLSSFGLGPYVDEDEMIEKTSVGKYKYTFLIPTGADLGAAFDKWEATVNLAELEAVFTFAIVGAGTVGTTSIYDNNAIYITLDSSIAALDGSTIGEDITTYFTTTYTPLYTHIKRVRLDLGPLVSDIEDDTINLAIFEASLMANSNTFNQITDPNYFRQVRKEYTTCVAELMLTRALSGDASIFGTMRKQLADLSVSRGASPQLMRNIDQLIKCVEKWERVIQTGGDKTPYTSIRPGYSVKGAASEDAMTTSRQWVPTSTIGGSAGNTKLGYTSRKGMKSYRSRYDPYSPGGGSDEDFE